MFGNTEWKKEVAAAIKNLELQIADVKKAETEVRAQNAKLQMMLKNLGRKIVMRMPLSLESLEKGLVYDLIFPVEIEAWRKATNQGQIIDIRPAHEFAKGSISGALSIPLDQLSTKLESLEKDRALLIVCDNGIRSVAATELLSSKGFPFVYVLKGGMALLRTEAANREKTSSTSAPARDEALQQASV